MNYSLSHILSLDEADVLRILKDAEAGLMIHNKNGEMVFINLKGLRLLKLDHEDASPLTEKQEKIAGRLFNEDGTLLSPSEYPPYAALKIKKNMIDRNIRIVDESGAASWIKMNCVVIYDTMGDVSEILTAFHDITAMRDIEEYLKDATKTIRSILYSSDATGDNYFFITDAVIQMLGFSPEEIISNPRKILHQINREDFPLFKNFSKKLRQGKPSVVEFRIKDKHGNEHYLRNSGIPVFESNVLTRVDGVINDITEEKIIQLELERSEERFRLLIETASDLIFNLNNYGYFVTVNSYGALALGYRPEEMIDKHFLEFVADDNKAEIALAFQQMLKSENIITFESTFTDKFGQNIVFEIQGRPTKSKGAISGLLGIARNITQRRRDEEKLRELNSKLIEANRLVSIERDRAKQQISVLEELNRLKSDFISNVSHELRTPLASVVGFSETISSDPDMPREMVMEFTNIILSEGKRLAKLINDVLDFAKMEAGEVTVFKAEFDIIL
ncbi:MAG: PAS domain S-box protein, partial [Syntrophothermus sp.]